MPIESPVRRQVRATAGPPRSQSGFSVIELIITLVVAGVLIAVAIPSFASLLNSNRVSSLSSDVIAAVQTARMEAVRQGLRVGICPSDDGAACASGTEWSGWIIFTDTDADSDPDAVLRAENVDDAVELHVSAAISTDSRIIFRPDGYAYTDAGALMEGRFNACVPTESPSLNIRQIDLLSGSRMQTTALDGDGACSTPENP